MLMRVSLAAVFFVGLGKGFPSCTERFTRSETLG